MPTQDPDASTIEGHLEKARRNYVLYTQLAPSTEYRDWAITHLFYAAIHLVQAHAFPFWLTSSGDSRAAS
jgi:hypothetical protein